jgi:transcriptional regulator with XRE-family HTH domain
MPSDLQKYAVFAKNLRQQCENIGSIAQICRDVNIHRQQFNKYLAGSSLPNAANLSRICLRLNVNADSLFNSQNPISRNLKSDTPHIELLKTETYEGLFLNQKMRFGNQPETAPSNIKDGSYYCYFPFPSLPDYVVRSFLHVWKFKNVTMFSRYTRVTKPGDARGVMFRGRHDGFIVCSAKETSLIGRNRHPPYQISVINISENSSYDGFLFGLSLTRATSNSIACRVALEPIGSSKPSRKLLLSTGLVNIFDKSVPPQIRAALAHIEGAGNHIVSAFDRDTMIARTAKL